MHVGVVLVQTAVVIIVAGVVAAGPGDAASAQGAESVELELPTAVCTYLQTPEGIELYKRCWLGDSRNISAISESTANMRTDSKVTIDRTGSLSVCSKPVMLDSDCQPIRDGEVTMCDFLSGELSCKTIKKQPGMDDSVTSLARRLQDPQAREDIATKSIANGIRQQLKGALASHPVTIIDNEEIIHAFDPDSAGLSELGDADGGAFATQFTIPADVLNDIVSDPGFEDRVRRWIQNNDLARNPWATPSIVQVLPSPLLSEGVLSSYYTDRGVRVDVFRPGTPSLVGPNVGTGRIIVPPGGTVPMPPPSIQDQYSIQLHPTTFSGYAPPISESYRSAVYTFSNTRFGAFINRAWTNVSRGWQALLDTIGI